MMPGLYFEDLKPGRRFRDAHRVGSRQYDVQPNVNEIFSRYIDAHFAETTEWVSGFSTRCSRWRLWSGFRSRHHPWDNHRELGNVRSQISRSCFPWRHATRRDKSSGREGKQIAGRPRRVRTSVLQTRRPACCLMQTYGPDAQASLRGGMLNAYFFRSW